MPADERRKWIAGILGAVLLAAATSAWGLYQWGGNKTHDLLVAKDAEMERRIERVERATEQIPEMAADIAAIRGYIEGRLK